MQQKCEDKLWHTGTSFISLCKMEN